MAERKVRDTPIHMNNISQSPTYSNPFIISLTDVPQGSNVISRIGDKISGTSLQVRLSYTTALDATHDQYMGFRLVVFIWKDDTVPTFTDIFDVAASPFDIDPLSWFFSHDKKIKRKVLIDYCGSSMDNYNLAVTGQTTWNPYPIKNWSIDLTKYFSLGTINFENGTLTGVNKIYSLFATTASSATKCWDFYMYTRYNFTDI